MSLLGHDQKFFVFSVWLKRLQSFFGDETSPAALIQVENTTFKTSAVRVHIYNSKPITKLKTSRDQFALCREDFSTSFRKDVNLGRLRYF